MTYLRSAMLSPDLPKVWSGINARPTIRRSGGGLIQRFKFTYERCHKMVKRFLEASSATPGEFDEADFQYLVRSASEQGLLLGDWPKWRGYREMRAKTSHTYDEEIALEVVAGIPAFLDEARYLLDQFEQRDT